MYKLTRRTLLRGLAPAEKALSRLEAIFAEDPIAAA